MTKTKKTVIRKQINQKRKPLGFNRKPNDKLTVRNNAFAFPSKIFIEGNLSKKTSHLLGDGESMEINNATAESLQKTIDSLRSGLPPEDDTALYVDNVYSEEFQEKELTLIRNSLGNDLLLLMLPHLSHQKLKLLLQVLQKNYELCSTNILAAKVASACIKTTYQHIASYYQQNKDNLNSFTSEDSVIFFKDWFRSLATYLVNNFEKFFIKGEEHCKLIKGFIESLQPPLDSDESNVTNNAAEAPLVHFTKEMIQMITFRFLDELTKVKSTAPGPEFKFTYIRLLRAIRPHNEIVDWFLRHFFALRVEFSDDEKLLTVFVNKYRDFIQPLFSICSTAMTDIFIEIFKDEIVDLISPKGVSCLRKLVATCDKKSQLKFCILQILPEFPRLVILEHYHPILTAMAEGCLRLNFWQKGFIKNILTILHCFKPKQLQLHAVEQLLYLIPYNKKQPKEDMFKTVTLHGTLIIQALLHYNNPIKIVKSMLSLDVNLMIKIAIDPVAYQIFKNFFNSKTIKNKAKSLLAQKFKGNIAVFGSNIWGKQVLDHIWAFANEMEDDNMKSSIAEELTESKTLGKSIHKEYQIVIKDHEEMDLT